MNALTRITAMAAFSAMLILGGTVQQACARSPIDHRSINYDIFLMNSLLGTAVGGAAGLTFGVLGDTEAEDVFSDYVLPGMGIGIISGVLYTLLYNDSPLYYSNMFMNNGQPKGLLHFDADSNLLDLQPLRALPRQEYSKKEDGAQWCVELLTISF